MSKHTFVNPVYGGQDPFTTKGSDGYYYSVAEGAGSREIWIYRSQTLADKGVRRTAWTAPEHGWNAYDVWAPELWFIRGKWYIYYCASRAQGTQGDDRQFENWELHRLGVLEAATDDPMGPYIDRGMLDVGDAMSIDASILELKDELYLLYTQREGTSKLFIAPMDSPTQLSGAPTMLCEPTYPWESDINEGPQVLMHGSHVHIIYSANAAHLKDYCLGRLTLINKEAPLEPASWSKNPTPVFKQKGTVMGPGHCSFAKSPDDKEDWMIYHSKFDDNQTLPDGWNRVINIQRFGWHDDGTPDFGVPTPWGVPQVLPSGTVCCPSDEDYEDAFQSDDGLVQYSYFRGHTIKVSDGALSIDGTADSRYGDKVIIRGKEV